MLYALAFLCPPLAVLIVRPLQFPLSLIFTVLFWIPGSIYAWVCVSDYRRDKQGSPPRVENPVTTTKKRERMVPILLVFFFFVILPMIFIQVFSGNNGAADVRNKPAVAEKKPMRIGVEK